MELTVEIEELEPIIAPAGMLISDHGEVQGGGY